jgi:P-type conjugative transfer protein TrbJ
MRNIMIKLSIASTFIFSVIPTYAMVPVIDTGAITQLVTQVSSLATQIQLMQQNLVNLGQYNWNDINSAAGQVASAMSAANSLSYASANIDQQFQQLNPGYKPNANFSQQYKDIATNTLNSVQGSLKAMNMSYSQFQNDSIRLKAMQSSASGSDGALKALQANAQITSEVAQQVSSLRSVMMAQSAAQQSYTAQQTQLEATKKANNDAMFTNGATTAPAYGTYKINSNF